MKKASLLVYRSAHAPVIRKSSWLVQQRKDDVKRSVTGSYSASRYGRFNRMHRSMPVQDLRKEADVNLFVGISSSTSACHTYTRTRRARKSWVQFPDRGLYIAETRKFFPSFRFEAPTFLNTKRYAKPFTFNTIDG